MSGTTRSTPRARRSNSAKKGDASASGWTAEQMSCSTPETRVGGGAGTAAERGLGLDDLHFESRAGAYDGRGRTPLGPLPTTVTSMALLQPRQRPIGWPGELACCFDR